MVYSVLDAASLALAPFQIDFIADGIGLIYAVANGHRTEAGLYTASLVAVGFGQYAATYLRSSDRFTLVAKLDNNGNVTEYEIKRANEIIESANEKPMMSSVADNLDDAKKDFNDALDVDFGLEMALDIEAATATGANTVVDIAEGAIESLNEVKAILEAANVSGPALAKFENIDAVQSIANRFKSTKGDGLEGIKNLLLDSKTNTRKQEIVDQLVKIDEIFPTTAPITITTKKSGNFNFIQIKDPADNLVAQMTGGNITKRQILENGDKIASYDGIDILKNGDIIGFKGYANWPYDKYVPNGALTKISDGSSSYKDVYSIAGEPDIVLAVMQPGKNVQTLINEVEALAKLKAQEIPAVEVLEQVIYEGRPAIIMKRYAGSSDNIAQLRGATVEIIGSSDAVTPNSIESLETIKDLLKQKEVDVVDLEFLIDANGRFFIADPSAVRLNTPPSEGNINLIDELIAQIKVNLAKTGARFIAKSGNELKTFLNGITDLPAGETYTGKFFKSVNTDFHPTPNPQLIDDYATLNLDHRYSKVGESGYYVSKSNSGNLTEMGFTNGVPSNYARFRYDKVQIDNMLDLTDDAIRQQLGVTEDMIKQLGEGKYEFTHEIGTWAKENYKGIIYPGAQGGNYENIIVFKQIDVDNALNNLTAIQIN